MPLHLLYGGDINAYEPFGTSTRPQEIEISVPANTPPASIPETGDSMNLMLMTILISVSAAALTMMTRRRKA